MFAQRNKGVDSYHAAQAITRGRGGRGAAAAYMRCVNTRDPDELDALVAAMPQRLRQWVDKREAPVMVPAAMEHVTYGYTGSQMAEGANTSMDKVRRCGDAVRAIVLWLERRALQQRVLKAPRRAQATRRWLAQAQGGASAPAARGSVPQ